MESEVDMNDHDEETLASLQQANDQLMAKNHALVKALSRATSPRFPIMNLLRAN